jgi:hypothetical protein
MDPKGIEEEGLSIFEPLVNDLTERIAPDESKG